MSSGDNNEPKKFAIPVSDTTFGATKPLHGGIWQKVTMEELADMGCDHIEVGGGLPKHVKTRIRELGTQREQAGVNPSSEDPEVS